MRQAAEVGVLPAHDEARLRAGRGARQAVLGGAGLTGERGIAKNLDAAGADEGSDLGLDLAAIEREDGVRVVGDGVENAARGDDGDADAVDFGTEEIGAMAGRVHPLVLNAFGRRADGDVFFNEAEVGSGLRGAAGDIEFAGVAVGDRPFERHAAAMGESGLSEIGVPIDGADAGLGAGLVGESEQLPGVAGEIGCGGRLLWIAVLRLGAGHGEVDEYDHRKNYEDRGQNKAAREPLHG